MWRLESVDPKSQITVLADSFQGKKLNSPNDLVYKSDGSLYFTDPPYGLPTQGDSDPLKEQTVNGVYRIAEARQHKAGAPPENDKLQLIIKDIKRPNGIAFSPDEKYLYIAESGDKVWLRYKVQPDGSVTDGQTFLDAKTDSTPGVPDGMRVDKKGNIYSAGPGGRLDYFPRRQAHRNDQGAGGGRQCGVGRQGREDTVHSCQHQRV